MTDVTPPEHITPAALYQMNAEQLDKLLEDIRERRLSSVRMYEEAKRAAKEASDEKARNDLMKQAEMCANNLARVDKALASLDTRINKMRVLRMELGLD
jgi:flagellar hook-associated protein FlgK